MDLVQFMNGIFVAIIVHKEGQSSLVWISDAGTHSVTLKARVTRNDATTRGLR